MDHQKKILVTGAAGQIGAELLFELRKLYGDQNVVALYHHNIPKNAIQPYFIGDSTNKEQMDKCIAQYNINEIYHLVALLSVKGEENPTLAYNVNMNSLKNILDIAQELKEKNQKKIKIFWPSSIAVFGPTTPQDKTPQKTILEPTTMYGVTKVAGELLVNYYYKKYGIDVRSLRYPGIISWKIAPGGGTTDYAIDIFYSAIKNQQYTCFLDKGSYIPMMYIDDAVRSAIELMNADESKITIRTSYNITAVSFDPEEIFQEIRKTYKNFQIKYKPDFRQNIANSWPNSIDDTIAQQDWGWKPKFGLAEIVEVMIKNLQQILL